MLYLTINTANVLSIFFKINDIKEVLKISIFFAFKFVLRTLTCHLTEMKHNTINFLHFTQLI